MQRLERVHLVQFFLFEAQTLELDTTSAIIAPNGAGKSALLDALQIVLLGGDRSRIRFNAQAGGASRARTIRDYCLGQFRSGEEGRKRKTATTYITLVFRDTDTDEVLSVGIALGASADEPDHRVHGLYLLPGVALDLNQHLEQVNGKTLPLTWAAFREQAARLTKQAGSKLELATNAERFVKDLLFRLRASPSAHPDINAYRKAFQNALNLQRVEDVDLFVRTLVAEDRPTDIGRFHALLETFRQIRDKIEQVAQRIDAAEAVEQQYDKIAVQAVRAASYRALSAEYQRDLLGEQVDTAEQQREQLDATLADTQRALTEARSERDLAREEHARAQARLQGTEGYGEQAQLDELVGRDRDRLAQLKQELLRDIVQIRDNWQAVAKLELPMLDGKSIASLQAQWDSWYADPNAVDADAALPWSPEQLHRQAREALTAAAPVLAMVASYARGRHTEQDKARDRLDAARQNQKRLAAGQAELNPEAVRLLGYLHDAGIHAQPVCDLVQIADPSWQPAIEAYLRINAEALLIPQQDEERAVKLYRGLQGGRSVYGVKLAMSSHARARGGEPERGSVAALLQGENAEALAFLRRQLGDLRCVDSEAELVRSRQGLTRDGLLAKGGSIERLRLPAAGDLKIGATDNRARLRVLHEDIEAAEAELRRLKPLVERADVVQRGLARIGDPDHAADALHARALEHHQAQQRHRAARDSHAQQRDPDLVRLSERVRDLQQHSNALDTQVERMSGQVAVTQNQLAQALAMLEALQAQQQIVARRAVEAFNHADVDPNRVEKQRDDMDAKFPQLEERSRRAEERARDSDTQLARLLPEAWSALAQYIKDHALAVSMEPDQWQAARKLLAGELHRLRDTELVQYRGEAEQAYETAVETFRANVASALYDNFSKLKAQIQTLNRTLRNSPAFSNNERYRFHFEVADEYKDLYRFIERASDLGSEDGLFGSAGEVPAAFRELIEDNSGPAGMATSPLNDYRRFFRFEVQIRQDERVIGTLSERMRSGSGGEHRAPLYVIAGAALAAAYGKSEAHPGGIGLILLDEFGDKIDAQNARATTNYLRSLGLQLVLAAPDTAQGTLSGILDSYIELFRDGDLLQVERIQIQPAARELMLSDQFDLHPELLDGETQRLASEMTAKP